MLFHCLAGEVLEQNLTMMPLRLRYRSHRLIVPPTITQLYRGYSHGLALGYYHIGRQGLTQTLTQKHHELRQ